MKCNTLGLAKEIEYLIIREEIIYPKACHEWGTIENHLLIYYKVRLLFGCKGQ